MIVGTGNVGASIAFSIVNQEVAVNELVLVDANKERAEGEAIDLSDAVSVTPGFNRIYAGTYEDARDCDIVVITAGAAQKEGETRMDLLNKNAAIMKGIVDPIMQSGFCGIFIVVTNPMDVMTYLVWKYSDLPSEKVIGSGTVLDSARLCQRLSEYINVSAKSIHAHQIGEHGDTEFALWSNSYINGQPIKGLLPKNILDDIEDYTRGEAYDIINRKGATYYGIGACVTLIIDVILKDENRVLSVSSYDDYTGVYNSFPAVLGRKGVVKRLELKMSEKEGVKFQKANNALKKAINSIKL